METDSVTSESNSAVANPCHCKTTCSRKTTAKTRGCPCKTAKVHCTELCTCGTKRKSCQNKQKAQGQSDLISSERPSEERLSEENERILENRRVKEFIATLDETMVRQLCVRALSRGVGSMEYVDSLLIMEDDDDSDSGNANAFSEESVGNVNRWLKRLRINVAVTEIA